MLDAVTPYVDWEAAQGGKSQQTDETDQDEYLTRKDIENMRRKDRELAELELLELRFEVANPDLKPYMKLVRAEYADVQRKNPRATRKQLVDLAAENTRKFLKKEHEKVVKGLKEDKRKEDEITASGLDSQGNPSPKQEERGQSADEYAAERKADLAQRKGQQLIK